MKKLTTLSLIIVTTTLLSAQTSEKIEYRGNIGLGLSKLNTTGSDISTQGGFGMWGDINATYFLSHNFGVSLGIGWSRYSGKTYLSNYTADVPISLFVNDGNTIAATPAIFHIIGNSDIVENTILHTFDIPIAAVYRNSFNNKIKINGTPLTFTGRTGIKLGIPLSSKYTLDGKSNMTTLLSIPSRGLENVGEDNDLTDKGLYNNRTGWSPSGSIDTRFTASLFVAAGVDYPINEYIALTASVYLSHGLNNPVNHSEQALITFPEQYNSVFSVSDNSKLMQLGVTLGIRFKPKKNKIAQAEKEIIPTVVETKPLVRDTVILRTEIIDTLVIKTEITDTLITDTLLVETVDMGFRNLGSEVIGITIMDTTETGRRIIDEDKALGE